METPTSSLQATSRFGGRRVLICFAIVVGPVLLSLRPLGLVRPFSVPTGAMTPALSRGDHFMMEGFTYLVRKPHRGDIIVFRADDNPFASRGYDLHQACRGRARRASAHFRGQALCQRLTHSAEERRRRDSLCFSAWLAVFGFE